MRTILFTGYEPYGRERYNPTGVLARAFNGHRIGGVRIRGVQIPVAVESAGPRLRKLIHEVQPAGVLATGVAPGRSHISVERVALNVLDFRIPDNRGRTYRDEAIRRDGPAAYFSTLPVRRILAALRKEGIPTEMSNTAGTYLCNFAMYTVLDALAAGGHAVPAGFIHVPQTPEATVDRPGQPSMDLATTRRALEVAIREVARGSRQGR